MKLYTGVVENRDDPLKLGRCQCRIVGLHTESKSLLPTSDLPWAHPMSPITSASTSGIGWSPVGPVPGTWVCIIFTDQDEQQPIMLGTLGGIPQSQAAVTSIEESDSSIIANDGGFLKDSSGTPVVTGSGVPVTVGSAESQSNPPADAKPSEPTTAAPDPANNTDIPKTPPKGSSSDVNASSKGIEALLKACDKLGLTTKYAKCAVLAIAGGESAWIPQKELYNYPPDNLKKVFTSATPEVIEKYSNAARKGMSREEFFSFFYGPTFRTGGKKPFLGNETDAEGGMYYGRGFIQLTGKGNYKRYGELSKIDLLKNPEILNSDIEKSAEVVVTYYIDRLDNYGTNKGRCFKLMHSPSFYEQALHATGVNVDYIEKKKLSYYEYFLGGKAESVSTTKESSPVTAGYTAEEIASAPPERRAALAEDRSANYGTLGFTDPNGKYPLRELLNEPDTNRLARGIIEGTCVAFKDTTLKTKVKKAGGGEWSQPHSAYAAKYPFNKVYETESGHVMEWDDSPGNERINIFHRKGSYMEYDPNGTKVDYIVGDNYIVMNRNGNIYVGGQCNITADAGVTILCNGDASIEVQGNSDIVMHGEATIGIANGLDLVVGNDINIKAGGSINIDAGEAITAKVGTDMLIQTGGVFHAKIGGTLGLEAGEEFLLRSSGMSLESQADLTLKASGAATIFAAGVLGIKGGEKLKLNSDGVAAIDGSTFLQQSGAAKGVPTPDAIGDMPDVDAVDLTPPAASGSTIAAPADLPEPMRDFDIVAKVETPEEWSTPAGKAEAKIQYDNTTYKSPDNAPGKAADSSTSTGNNVQSKPAISAPDIITRSDFPLTYSISKNFILGNFVKPSDPLRDSPPLPASIGDKGGSVALTVKDLVSNLALWAENCGEPLYDMMGPAINKDGRAYMKGATDKNAKWVITSGLRTSDWKEYGTSEHGKGQAVDCAPLLDRPGVFDFIKKIEKFLPYNQLILEYRRPGSKYNPGNSWQNWVHISHSPRGNGKMAFTMVDDKVVNAQMVPTPGVHGGFHLF
jgi:predicted chitinase